jgi:hypothetical protein
LASLEAKKSDQDGRYYISEPTVGRNDYQVYLAVAGGVNLTEAAFYDAIGERVEMFPRRIGRATWIDEDYAARALGSSNYGISFYYRNIAKNISRRIAFSHLNLSDPVPFILLVSSWLPKPVGKIIRRLVHWRVR